MNTASRYDQFAPLYEYGERMLEIYLRNKRKLLHKLIKENRILEVGIGSGRSISYYKAGTNLFAGDLSRKMMHYAVRRSLSRAIFSKFCSFDIEKLPYKDSTFPAVVSSLVFCTVNDPLKGLQEIRRVLEPTGSLYMLEHVKPQSKAAQIVFDALNPLSVSLIGDHLTRNTSELVKDAGFRTVEEYSFALGVFRIVVASKK
ncbi:methyltransferase type 11 [Chitinispirillum alkaliphilum]|nr:methyltransferase type 11 [Chitinispirillum alkaliphilum]